MTIRLATVADIAEMAALVERSFLAAGVSDYSYGRIPKEGTYAMVVRV
jgi:hypothetical protein